MPYVWSQCWSVPSARPFWSTTYWLNGIRAMQDAIAFASILSKRRIDLEWENCSPTVAQLMAAGFGSLCKTRKSVLYVFPFKVCFIPKWCISFLLQRPDLPFPLVNCLLDCWCCFWYLFLTIWFASIICIAGLVLLRICYHTYPCTFFKWCFFALVLTPFKDW